MNSQNLYWQEAKLATVDSNYFYYLAYNGKLLRPMCGAYFNLKKQWRWADTHSLVSPQPTHVMRQIILPNPPKVEISEAEKQWNSKEYDSIPTKKQSFIAGYEAAKETITNKIKTVKCPYPSGGTKRDEAFWECYKRVLETIK